VAYETTDLPKKLGRYHADVDRTFLGLNDIWLAPPFRAWNIEDVLPAVTARVLLIQGADDEYGTTASSTRSCAGEGPGRDPGAAGVQAFAAPRQPEATLAGDCAVRGQSGCHGGGTSPAFVILR